MNAALLPFEHHVSIVGAESGRLADDADAAGLDALVPSCPGWTVADLVHHQGAVHRWATARVQGLSPEASAAVGDEAEQFRPDDLLDWFRQGAHTLVAALRAAPADLAGRVFLADPPPTRDFWARRQAHETTIHRIDALSAERGVLPTAARTGLQTPQAVDGIDELLTGFLPRRSTRLRSPEPFSVTVAPTDTELAWTVTVSPDPPVTRREADRHAAAVLTGTSVALYLGLWNRGDEIAETGDEDALGLWREKMRISWR